jgi:hypothetical protein
MAKQNTNAGRLMALMPDERINRKQMKVYISGKISGLKIEKAREKFERSAERLRGLGHEPVNPFEITEHIGDAGHWREYMVEDIKAMMECDAVFMQTDWPRSRGARIENFIARETGMKIMYEGNCIHNKKRPPVNTEELSKTMIQNIETASGMSFCEFQKQAKN